MARLLAAAACVAVVVVLAGRLADHDACTGAREGIFKSVAHRAQPEAVIARHVATVRERCRGADGLIAAAGGLKTLGRDRESVALAREAVRREPESFAAWRALGIAATGAEAERARRRATELSPLPGP